MPSFYPYSLVKNIADEYILLFSFHHLKEKNYLCIIYRIDVNEKYNLGSRIAQDH